MTLLDSDVLEVLGEIERGEARLLTWGVVDTAMSDDELLAVIQESADGRGYRANADDILDALLEAGLVLEARDVGPEQYRSRMAEAVRLFARLRQWFHGRTWLTAP